MSCGDLDSSDGGWGGREVSEGLDICTHVAVSLHCIAGSQHCKATVL